MKIHACIIATLCTVLLACGGSTEPDDRRELADADASCAPSPEPDAATIVDSCVENLHSSFACTQAQLPTVYTAIDCAGTPKQMHRESGTLIVRPDGREGCVEQTNYKGEHLTCCPACDVGRVPCLGGCCAK